MAAPAGPSGCWPRRWSSSGTWGRSRMRASARLSKKRAEALAEEVLVHPAVPIGRVRLPDGGGAGAVQAALRPRGAAGLPGRDLQATDLRDPRAGAGPPRAAGPLRRGLQARRGAPAVHDLRAVA